MLRSLMPVRLVALDIDGTLLNSNSEVAPAVVRAVQRTRESGVEVVLATGRRFRTTRVVAETLSLDGHAVVFNGGVLKDLSSGRTLDAVHLSRDVLLECADSMRPLAPPIVYCDSSGGETETDMLAESHPDEHALQREYLDSNRSWLRTVDDITADHVGPALMLATIGTADRLEPLYHELRERLGSRAEVRFLANPAASSTFLEILPASTSKWHAVSRLADELGIEHTEVLAIGDDTNDLEMIRGAGIGVAMGNAVDPVRDAADWVTKSHDDDGVARALERFVLD